MMSFSRGLLDTSNSNTSVITTGVPLSQRFQSVPGHNPLRPNLSRPAKAIGRNVGVRFDVIDDDDDDLEDEELTVIRTQRKPFVNFGVGNVNGGNTNKLAILRATKDAEILRLRAQLRACKMKLIALSQRNANNKGIQGRNFLRSVQNVPMKNRNGGGIKFGRTGKQLNLIGKKFVKGFNNDTKPGISPMNRKRGGGVKFFGEPRSREDLDQEIDAYMAQTKGKQKTDLDKELEDYMAVARSQSLALKMGAAQPPVVIVNDDLEDATME